MAIKKDSGAPKVGINRDTSSFEVGKEFYTFAYNANLQDEHGSGRAVLQNEPSNVKCTDFKSGYKVVGHKYDGVTERTYFFLTNPTTGFSEIGFINSLQELSELVPTETGTGDSLTVVLEDALENIVQVGNCLYTTLITDLCSSGSTTGGKCLNFSTEYPIHENNIQIKHGKTGTTMWFTDFNNPYRYIQLDNLEIYTTDIDPCDDIETDICLDCEKMRVFKLFEKPCLTPTVIQAGGVLKAGMYEFVLAYSDFDGNELSNYYSITNPVSIFDFNNTILDQTLLDYQTNQAIAVDVAGVDDSYEYYKIVVAYRSGLDSSVSYFALGVYPTNQTTFTAYDLQGKVQLSETQIYTRIPFYEKVKGLAVSNGYIYPYGLVSQRQVNLQPVVNLLGSLARWSTYQAMETLYEDGVDVSNYRGYMRDEVYPFGIKFFFDGGQETALFPFVPRPPKASEIEVLGTVDYPENDETNSVLENNPECSANTRDKRWQFENTAEELEDCLVTGSGTSTYEVIREVSADCYVVDGLGEIDVLDTIASSSIVVDANIDLVTYINMNRDEIIASVGANGADIRGVLEDPTDYPETCDPVFDTNCDSPAVLSAEEMFAISVGTQATTEVLQDLVDYTPSEPPTALCSMYELNSGGSPGSDDQFITDYMVPGENVYSRINPANTVCTSAIIPPGFSNPQVDTPNYLKYAGEYSTIGTLQGTRTVSATYTRQVISLTQTIGGTANVDINGTNYLATYDGVSMATTVATFVSTHAAAILLDTDLVATAVGDTIVLTGDYAGFFTTTITNLTGDLDGTFEGVHFTDKLHSNAIWFKVDFSGSDYKIFELGTTACQFPDDNTSQMVRISVFTDCSTTTDEIAYATIVADISVNDVSKFVQLIATDFGGTYGTAYITIDSPIRTREIAPNIVNTLMTPCDCFPVFIRESVTAFLITYTDLTFGKKQTYTTNCTYVLPKLGNCSAVPYKKGLFSYWESTEKYPCNKELYDSSELVIEQADIPAAYQVEFESYYVDAVVAGEYTLSPTTDFRDQNIRHYKFPDNNIAPFMSTADVDPGAFNKSIIYPIGFYISPEVVSAFLDIAVNNGLLTATERSRINSYEIYRGDRRVQKSVLAKGILFDMYKYEEENNSTVEDVYYPNYPLNTLGADQLNGSVAHPFNSTENNFFTFHSPDTSFYKPTLARELYVEGYLFGNSANYFDEVLSHPTYIILGQASYTLATSLAIAEVVFETFLQSSTWIVTAAAGGVSAPAAAISAALAIAGLVVGAVFKTGEYRYKWLETITNLGKPVNFAYYQVSVGHYNYFKPNNVAAQRLRGLTLNQYVKDGRWSLANEVTDDNYNLNNLDREYAVAMHTGNFPVVYRPDYTVYDNYTAAPFNASRRTYNGIGKSGKIVGRAASPYAAIKQYSPAQYGEIGAITWLSTGFCGDLASASDCDAAFGGDIFISRFALKRKLPFFRTNSFGLAPLTPFKYSDYFNINPPTIGDPIVGRYYVDYEINDDSSNFLSIYLFPDNKSAYNLDSLTNENGFYLRPPSKFYLYSYGIPYFLVESEINCNYRYAKREAFENFYPNINDVIEWTQEKNVSIRQPNTYFYNTVYSAGQSFYPYVTLPQNFTQEISDRLNTLTNTVIYSNQDVSESSLFDPWLRYKPLDTYTFTKSYGDLVTISGIESLQLLARFTNGVAVFGAIDQMRDRLTPETENLGNGGIFAGRPINFHTTNLGHAGTQNNAMTSTEFGHTWVDAKRGKVFRVQPNGQGLEEISFASQYNTGVEKWFKENLPFKILQDLPNVDIDNAYNGVGITMGWDDRLKRLFITKKDYRTTSPGVQYAKGIGFYINDRNNVGKIIVIEAGDPEYFTDCSWTIAYSPMLKSWISYYGFKPSYYVAYNDYFQTGKNETGTKFGLWSHYSFQSSYQVFYGELQPFIVEFMIPAVGADSVLHSIEYLMDVRKYYNRYNFTDIYGKGFNRAYVYSSFQNSGQLNLVHQVDDDMTQTLNYPTHNASSIDILQAEVNGKWSFNYLYNRIRNERAGLPIWIYDCPQILKVLDNRLLDYEYKYLDYLRGEYFLVRLEQDQESRYKMLFRGAINEREYYEY